MGGVKLIILSTDKGWVMKINFNYVLVSVLLMSGCGSGGSPSSLVADPDTIAQNYQKLGANVDTTTTANITLDENGYP